MNFTSPGQQVGAVSVGSTGFTSPGQQVGGFSVGNTGFTSPGQQVGGFSVGNMGFTSPGQQVGGFSVGNTEFVSPGQQVGGYSVSNTEFASTGQFQQLSGLSVGSTDFTYPGQEADLPSQQDMDEIISILSQDEPRQNKKSTFAGEPSQCPTTPQTNATFSLQLPLPTTPQGKKIEKIIRQKRYEDAKNAGRLARALATDVFFGNEVLRLSSPTGNGMWNNVQLQKLADEKMEEIEDIIRCLYRSKVKNVHSLWEGCRISIGKKCQSLRKGQTDE